MKGLDVFVELFGDITVLQIVKYIIALIFIITIYKQVKKIFRQKFEEQAHRAEAEKERDEQLSEALSAVRKYPEYRQQSLEIQHQLNDKLAALDERLSEMEEATKRRERNKIRDRLLQNYRYYTNPDTNPSQSWSKMESEAFLDLFGEYENANGDGYMHTVVQPEMERLLVTDMKNN